MDELRILQIIKGLDIGGLNGGAERFSIDLSEQLKNVGCKLTCARLQMDTKAEIEWLDKIREQRLTSVFATNWAGPNNLRGYITGSETLKGLVKSKRT